MKQISQEEFEQYVEAIIRGEMSRAQVIKELQTEARTLNNRIHELVRINPELHRRFVEKYPYKPKERKDLDAMQLAIEILKQERTIEQIAQEYQTGRRTIQRRINTLRNSQSLLERRVYDLCKEVGQKNSRKGGKVSEELARCIQQVLEEIEEKMPKESRSIETNVEERRQELLELERKYNELCQTMTKGEAAKTLGYTRSRMFKLLNELYRIEIERAASVQNKDFRQGLKVEVEGIKGRTKESRTEIQEVQEKELE